MRFVEVDGREREAAKIELIAKLQRGKQIVVLCRRVLLGLDGGQIFLDGLDAVAHHARVKAVLLAPAVEIRGIEGQRLMHLEPRDAEGHHDIGCRVCFREEVFDLFARANVPVRNTRGDHFLLRALRQAAALSDGLHDLERALFRHAAFDEIEHDVVAAPDGVVDAGGLGQDQVARISEPHVRAV